jgi:hypothetical protein
VPATRLPASNSYLGSMDAAIELFGQPYPLQRGHCTSRCPEVGANIFVMNCSFFVGERVSSQTQSTLTPSPCKPATQVSRYRAATELLISK